MYYIIISTSTVLPCYTPYTRYIILYSPSLSSGAVAVAVVGSVAGISVEASMLLVGAILRLRWWRRWAAGQGGGEALRLL